MIFIFIFFISYFVFYQRTNERIELKLKYQRSKSKTSICLLLSKFLVTVETTRRDKLGHANAYLNAFQKKQRRRKQWTTTLMTHGKMLAHTSHFFNFAWLSNYNTFRYSNFHPPKNQKNLKQCVEKILKLSTSLAYDNDGGDSE